MARPRANLLTKSILVSILLLALPTHAILPRQALPTTAATLTISTLPPGTPTSTLAMTTIIATFSTLSTTTATISPTSATASATASVLTPIDPSSSSNTSASALPPGALAGVILGGIALVLISGGLLYLYNKKGPKPKVKHYPDSDYDGNGGAGNMFKQASMAARRASVRWQRPKHVKIETKEDAGAEQGRVRQGV